MTDSTSPNFAAPAPVSALTPSRPSSVANWTIAFLLGVIATLIGVRTGSPALPVAQAQNQGLAGARGVYAFTGQVENNRWGLFMLDVDQGTIWCYELNDVGNSLKLKLVAARSWVYDRLLQDFNNETPDFRMVQELVAQQRSTNPAGKPAAPADPGPAEKKDR